MHGINGKILHVDLTNEVIEIEQPSEDFYRLYMGGSALGLYYILKYVPPLCDAFDARNLLIFSLSVLTGIPISGQSRITVNSVSPLTNAIGDSQAGGFFPAELKFAGYDAIVIHGKAKTPKYLWIHEGEVELRNAEQLWGKVTGESEKLIKQELADDKIEVIQIGPAGENLVRFASIINRNSRANGRNGMGAVMGSKLLKAIVVSGKVKPTMADEAMVKKLAKWGISQFPESNIVGLKLYGTGGSMGWQNEAGGLPTYNWSSGNFNEWESISGQTIAKSILKRRDTCYACVVNCKRRVEIDHSELPVNQTYGGPEYETLAAFGSYCGISDLHAIAYANQICNMYGMDTISCGATIAWAMDCHEQGILSKKDLDGIELKFGNASAMVQMVQKIALRDGIGNILAEGSFRAAEALGRGSDKLVVTSKKQELPAHMPQVKRSLALIYAVNPFGADHQSHEHDPSYNAFPQRMAEIGLTNPQPDQVLNEEKVKYALTTQYIYSALDSLSVCQFVFGPAWQLYSISDLAKLVSAVTGWDVNVSELIQLGKRRLNMMRMFNARRGFNRNDDTLPVKLTIPLQGGVSNGLYINLDEVEHAKDIYYQMAGWNISTGNPTSETLKELSLEWIING